MERRRCQPLDHTKQLWGDLCSAEALDPDDPRWIAFELDRCGRLKMKNVVLDGWPMLSRDRRSIPVRDQGNLVEILKSHGGQPNVRTRHRDLQIRRHPNQFRGRSAWFVSSVVCCFAVHARTKRRKLVRRGGSQRGSRAGPLILRLQIAVIGRQMSPELSGDADASWILLADRGPVDERAARRPRWRGYVVDARCGGG
jgi:hypothetical protein